MEALAGKGPPCCCSGQCPTVFLVKRQKSSSGLIMANRPGPRAIIYWISPVHRYQGFFTNPVGLQLLLLSLRYQFLCFTAGLSNCSISWLIRNNTYNNRAQDHLAYPAICHDHSGG